MAKFKEFIVLAAATVAVSVLVVPCAASSESVTIGPQLVEGILGKAYSFNGETDYIEVKESSSLDISGNKITISAWVKLSSVDKPQVIISKGAKGKGTWLAGIVPPDSNNPRLSFFVTGLASEGFRDTLLGNKGVIYPQVWHHVAFIYDGNEKTIYVDGKRDASQACSGNIPTNDQPLRIGTWGSPESHFCGTIDEVAIFNRALSSDQIRRLYENVSKSGTGKHVENGGRLKGDAPGLVAYWDFDADKGEVVKDKSPNHNDGKLSRVTTEADLAAKGFPKMTNPRKASYTQTAAQTTAEVVADLGNVMIMGYCLLGRGGGNIYAPNELGFYRTRIMPNMKVIRLIEEGRNGPAKVSRLLRDAVRQCLADYDKDLKAWNEARSRGENASGTGDDDPYYNKYRKYECPQREFRRIHDVAYMSLYILANIGRLDADLLAEWIRKEKPQLYHCPDIDLWLIDAYFRQASQTLSDAAMKHAALTKGLNIAGQKTIQSKWDQPWDIHDQMFRMAKINPADIETIKTLVIPPELPPELDQDTKSRILKNFLKYAENLKVGNCEEGLRDPATFASLGRKHELIYTWAKECFTTEDLPEMYTLLNQDEHVDEWRFIAQLIGFVSKRGNRNSIDVLLAYLKRQDVWPKAKEDPKRSYDVGMGKILCLQWIGMVGGEHAEEILLGAITPEGAEELTKEWLDFTEVAYPGGKERATASIRGRAAIGLVFCQSAKGIEIVERMYEEEKQRCIQNKQQYSAMFGGMVDAMANKAYIDEHGLQKRLELYGRGDYLDIISEYIKRYSLW